MNNTQNHLLIIASIYINVCEILNLKYFAIGGTALGAIRHKGFIPWDDDIDFCMPRDDYNKFIKEGQKYLPNNLFIQSFETEKNYFCPFAKIRDSNTTAIENADKNLDINHGLWIDIFPLDGMPLSIKRRKFLYFFEIKLLRRRYLPYQYVSDVFRIKCANFFVKVLFPTKRIAFKISRRNSIKFNFKESELVWWNWNNPLKHNFKREWFDDYKIVDFENIKIRVPVKCEEYLTEHFGDWKKLPPVNERVSVHNLYKIDLSRSYLEYYK